MPGGMDFCAVVCTYGSQNHCKPSCLYGCMYQRSFGCCVFNDVSAQSRMFVIAHYALTTLFIQGSSLKSVCFQRHSPCRCSRKRRRFSSSAHQFSLSSVHVCECCNMHKMPASTPGVKRGELAAYF